MFSTKSIHCILVTKKYFYIEYFTSFGTPFFKTVPSVLNLTGIPPK